MLQGIRREERVSVSVDDIGCACWRNKAETELEVNLAL